MQIRYTYQHLVQEVTNTLETTVEACAKVLVLMAIRLTTFFHSGLDEQLIMQRTGHRSPEEQLETVSEILNNRQNQVKMYVIDLTACEQEANFTSSQSCSSSSVQSQPSLNLNQLKERNILLKKGGEFAEDELQTRVEEYYPVRTSPVYGIM